MILEVALLNVKEGMSASFEDAFTKAKNIISKAEGFISLQLEKMLGK